MAKITGNSVTKGFHGFFSFLLTKSALKHFISVSSAMIYFFHFIFTCVD